MTSDIWASRQNRRLAFNSVTVVPAESAAINPDGHMSAYAPFNDKCLLFRDPLMNEEAGFSLDRWIARNDKKKMRQSGRSRSRWMEWYDEPASWERKIYYGMCRNHVALISIENEQKYYRIFGTIGRT